MIQIETVKPRRGVSCEDLARLSVTVFLVAMSAGSIAWAVYAILHLIAWVTG